MLAFSTPIHATDLGLYSQGQRSDTIERTTLPLQSSAKMTALLELADRDPAAAFAEAQRFYQEQRGAVETAEATLASYLLEKDFTRAAEIFKLVSQPMARQSTMFALVPRALKRDPSGTWATIRDKLTGKDQGHAFSRVVLAQVRDLNWRGAIETQMAIEKGQFRRQAIFDIGPTLATADLNMALSWREQLTGDDQKMAHMRILDGLSEARDDVGLERLLAVTPLTDDIKPYTGGLSWDRDRMITRIAFLRLDRGDTAGIGKLRNRLPAREQELIDAIVISTDETIPPAVRVTRVFDLKSETARSNGITRIVQLEWEKDPEQTKTLVRGLPEETFGTAFSAMAQQWKDKRSLSEWIKQLDAGSKRERAISTFVMSQRSSRKEDEFAMAREVATWAAMPEAREKFAREFLQIEKARQRERFGGD